MSAFIGGDEFIKNRVTDIPQIATVDELRLHVGDGSPASVEDVRKWMKKHPSIPSGLKSQAEKWIDKFSK